MRLLLRIRKFDQETRVAWQKVYLVSVELLFKLEETVYIQFADKEKETELSGVKRGENAHFAENVK